MKWEDDEKISSMGLSEAWFVVESNLETETAGNAATGKDRSFYCTKCN